MEYIVFPQRIAYLGLDALELPKGVKKGVKFRENKKL
jgi:hypothetical protein